MQRLVAAVARLLEAAERRGHVAHVVLVDPHAAGAQGLADQVGAGQVAGPDAGSQAVDGVVGDGHGFFGAVETDHRQYRAEDFFLGDAHGIGHAVEHGRLDVGAAGFFQHALAAGHQLGAVVVTGLDVGQHVVHLGGIDQRADVGFRVQRVARLPRLDRLDHHRYELVLDRIFHQQARTGGADFALVEGDGTGGTLGGGLEVRRVGEDDVRALAAGFQPDALHVRFAGIDHQLLGDLGRAGEHQGVDVHVQGQGLAHGVTEARQHVEHAGRNAGLDGQLGDADAGQRRLFGRLEDHRVAGGQRRAELPAGHQQREVPRHDGGDHADRLTGHQAQFVVGGGGHFVVDLVDGLTAPAQRTRGGRHVDTQRIADRLAHVQGFQQGQLLGVGVDQVGEADHDFLALDRRHARPHAGLEGGTSDLDRALGVGAVTAGDMAEQAAVDRADALEGGRRDRVGVFALDEGAALDLQVLGALFPVGTGQGGHAGILEVKARNEMKARIVNYSSRPLAGHRAGNTKPERSAFSIFLTFAGPDTLLCAFYQT